MTADPTPDRTLAGRRALEALWNAARDLSADPAVTQADIAAAALTVAGDILAGVAHAGRRRAAAAVAHKHLDRAIAVAVGDNLAHDPDYVAETIRALGPDVGR
ncbi:MAG TPA: hypothetical protein VLA52_01370 [Thermohalobaculum sp.]|nr:hypothetical protein [Thermohalobaculum sp.]